GLTGQVVGSNVILYGTTGGSAAAGGGTLYTFTDTTGYNGTISGTANNIATAAANTAFRGIAFAPVNHAPVLNGANNFSAINEDDTTNSGTLVSTLISGKVTDDSGEPSGIAVTATDTSNGSWQYSTDGGSNWNNVGSVSDTSALLLKSDSNTRLRFVPNANYF